MATNYLKMALIILVLSLASCFSRSAMMTYSDYSEIETGDSVHELYAQIGKPYAIHNKKEGIEEYEYVERMDAGDNLFAENHYFLIVKDGKVTGKYMTRERPPAYDLIYQPEPNYSN